LPAHAVPADAAVLEFPLACMNAGGAEMRRASQATRVRVRRAAALPGV